MDKLSTIQNKFMVGTLLGDASLQHKTPKRYKVGDDDDNDEDDDDEKTYSTRCFFAKSSIHSCYFKHVAYIFCNHIKTSNLNISGFRDNKVHEKHEFNISKPFLTDLWYEWYVSNIKICPSYFEDIFDEIIISFWYQDDGTLNQSITKFCTQSFDMSTQDRLVVMLEKLGYTSAYKYIYNILNSYGNEQYMIVLNNEDSLKLIAKLNSPKYSIFVCEAMKYKNNEI